MEMKQTVNKLYGFIAKLVILMESELDELGAGKSKSAINVKKNITDTLNKLVHLIVQLNKLNTEDPSAGSYDISSTDRDIINRFIERYKNEI